MSFAYNRPVIEVIGERFLLTIVISVVTLLFSYLIAIPIGVYSATRQYSGGDYLFSFMGFIGMAVPNFILAMIAMYLANRWFGISIGGLFSAEYQSAAWSGSKLADLLAHLPVPVTTARSKGLPARTVIYRYPLRIAMNPLVSGMSRILADIVSGSTITAIVLNLPTMGPLLQDALMQQDTYLAGAAILLQCALVLVGTLLSDLILVAMDPRIRLEK
jgi:peptide/nickel transport system permease protein